MTTASASGSLRASSVTFASLPKASAARTTAGLPLSISLLVSWILHDVHDPQFARPTIAASHSSSTRRSVASAIAPFTGMS
jgi:hypothetical protein